MSDSKKFWDRQAKRFSESGNNESKKLIEKSKDYLTSQMTLLDFACGTGQSSVLFSEHVNQVVGLDYSEEMIKLASNNHFENIDFVQGTLDHESLKDSSFDVVSAFNILHLVEDIDETIAKISTLIKPNGFFISNTPCIGEKKTMWVKIITALSRIKLFPQVFPLKSDELITKLIKYGFTCECVDIKGDKIKNVFLIMKKENH